MIVEILGAKMLAPYVGTSHFVWTAQIGVTLVALAAGVLNTWSRFMLPAFTPALLNGRWMVRVSIGAELTERVHVQQLWSLMKEYAE